MTTQERLPRRWRMSNADAAWLGLSSAENLMVVTAVLWFDQPVDWARLRGVVGERLVGRYSIFRRRAVPTRSPFDQPVWEEDPGFDLEEHLTHLTLDADTGADAYRALARVVSRQLSTPVDLSRSPWHLTLVDGYDGRSALVARLHHSLADGIALASVLLSLTDVAEPTASATAEGQAAGDGTGQRDPRRPGLLRRALAGTSEVSAVAGLPPARHPIRQPRGVLAGARFVWSVAVTAVELLTLSRDPRTRISGRLGVRKQAAWSRPRDLDEIKRVAAALDVTVNDVLLAAVAGAVRRYVLAHGEAAHDVRVFVPVNLRPPDDPDIDALGNRFGLLLVRLPVATPDGGDRVRAVKAQTERLKTSTQGAATYALISLLGFLPGWLHGSVVRILGSKTSAIVSNVPGPRQQVALAGTAVDGIVFWVPQSGPVGLGVSIFSYDGTVTVGVAADAGLIADPEALVAAMDAEFDALAVLGG